VLVVTTDGLSGYEIRSVLGEVLGVTACTRNPYVAGFRSLDGGQGAEMAQVLVQSRATAIGQMINAARSRGANAIVGMRFDNRDITGNWVEICAYGTAVVAVPLTEDAIRQDAAFAQLGQAPHQAGYRGPDAPPGASAGPAPMPSTA
jgi:uncharacterized protein YbjQ (UPF0145 family)